MPSHWAKCIKEDSPVLCLLMTSVASRPVGGARVNSARFSPRPNRARESGDDASIWLAAPMCWALPGRCRFPMRAVLPGRSQEFSAPRPPVLWHGEDGDAAGGTDSPLCAERERIAPILCHGEPAGGRKSGLCAMGWQENAAMCSWGAHGSKSVPSAMFAGKFLESAQASKKVV